VHLVDKVWRRRVGQEVGGLPAGLGVFQDGEDLVLDVVVDGADDLEALGGAGVEDLRSGRGERWWWRLSERGKKKMKKTKGEKRRDLSLVDDDDRLAAALKSSPLSLSPPRQQEHNILPMARAGAEEEKLQQSQQKDPRARESESTAWVSLFARWQNASSASHLSLSKPPTPLLTCPFRTRGPSLGAALSGATTAEAVAEEPRRGAPEGPTSFLATGTMMRPRF
jgi:hypothetical protein